MKLERSSGIILHPTALPGQDIGTLGRGARLFIDFLADAGQRLWQVCPLGPTGFGNSPYQGFSAFAGNPLLIDEALLSEAGWLDPEQGVEVPVEDPDRVRYAEVIARKWPLLRRAGEGFRARATLDQRDAFSRFCEANAFWLPDYALFMALKERFGQQAWERWDEPVRQRDPAALERCCTELADTVELHKFVQYVFFSQWTEVKAYARRKEVKIIGDIPIFVAFDSADVWAQPDLFQFGDDGKPTAVAGVPPDYFSETGQLWGNPLYDWERHAQTGYAWWIDVIRSKLQMYDLFRVDHFRGFAGYWKVPYGEKTAINGCWTPGPGADFFEAVQRELGDLPLIAEDLGLITDDVVRLRDDFGFPGMKVLQFAFDSDDDNEFRPHTWPFDCVAYTGTHDNDTVRGWYQTAKPRDREYAAEYLGSDGKDVVWDFLRGVWASTAAIAMAPLQDVLGLGSEARFNTPGTLGGNWEWRTRAEALSAEVAARLRRLSLVYARSGDLMRRS